MKRTPISRLMNLLSRALPARVAANVLGGLSLAVCAPAVLAASVSYSVTNISSGLWRYDYTIVNSDFANPIAEITLYFERDLFGLIGPAAGPTGWDNLVIQSDSSIPADGFFDSI